MKNKYLWLTCLSLLVLLFSCGCIAQADTHDISGVWQSNTMPAVTISFDGQGSASGSYMDIPFHGSYTVSGDSVLVNYGSLSIMGDLGEEQYKHTSSDELSSFGGTLVLKKLTSETMFHSSIIGSWESPATSISHGSSEYQTPILSFLDEKNVIVIQGESWDNGTYIRDGLFIKVRAFGKDEYCYVIDDTVGLNVIPEIGMFIPYKHNNDTFTADITGYWCGNSETYGLLFTSNQKLYDIKSLEKSKADEYDYKIIDNFLLISAKGKKNVKGMFIGDNQEALEVNGTQEIYYKKQSEESFAQLSTIGQPTPVPTDTPQVSPVPTPEVIDYTTLEGSWQVNMGFYWYGYIFNDDNTGYELSGQSYDEHNPSWITPITYSVEGKQLYIYSGAAPTILEMEMDNNRLHLKYERERTLDDDIEGNITKYYYHKLPYRLAAATPSPMPAVAMDIADWLYGVWQHDEDNGWHYQYMFSANDCWYNFFYRDDSGMERSMEYYYENGVIKVSGEVMHSLFTAELIPDFDGDERILYIMHEGTKYHDPYKEVYKKVQGKGAISTVGGTTITLDWDSLQQITAIPETPKPTITPIPKTPAPVSISTTTSSVLESIGLPDRMKVRVAQIDSNSWITNQEGYQFVPANMLDEDESTSFQFSTNAKKLGKEYLYFAFQEPVTIDELWMKNGVWTSPDAYTRNSRVKSLSIDYIYAGGSDYIDRNTIKLPDEKYPSNWMVLQLGAKNNVIGVRIRIDDQYTGTVYKTDVCISELMFVQKTK